MVVSSRFRIALLALVVMAAAGAGFSLVRLRNGDGAAAAEAIRTLRPQQAAVAGLAAGDARIALIIGNGSYEEAPLRNPVNDAKAMKQALEDCRFDVTLKVNASKREMEEAIQAFGDRIRGGAVGLFYYAGHGVAVKGTNYLIPVGAKLSREDEVPYEGVDVGRVLDKMDTARNQLNILILDACRNNPFARSWRSSSRGLVQVSAPKGSLIAYATAPGSTAADGSGEHGLYTEALLAKLKEPGVSLLDVFQDVRAEVESRSQGQQIPWESNSTVGRFYFRPATPAAPVQPPPPTPAVAGQAAPMPAGKPGGFGSGAAEPPPVPGAVQGANGLWEARLDIGLGARRGLLEWFKQLGAPKDRLHATLDLVQIHGGSYRSRSDQGKVHEVRISSRFWLGRFPVTQRQWLAVMGTNPAAFQQAGLDAPVEQINWDDTTQFLDRLNAMQATWTFRRPTRAEMEYACRAGTEGERYGPLDAIAWYEGNSGGTTHPVGQKQPNAFGLYDMNGNVLQWCQDWYEAAREQPAISWDPRGPAAGENRVSYGGSWRYHGSVMDSTMTVYGLPDMRIPDLGFRVAADPRTP
jgi:hypothetical protein